MSLAFSCIWQCPTCANPQRNQAWAGTCLLANWPHPEGAWQPREGVLCVVSLRLGAAAQAVPAVSCGHQGETS